MAILDRVQWTDQPSNVIVHREPEVGSGEFRLGSQLIVREGQTAVFERDGKALDEFGPGRYTLSTNNVPLLGRLIGLPFGGESPFTAEVYFVATTEFTDLKWGTSQPLTFKDEKLGMVRLRAFGNFSVRVENPTLLVSYIVGAKSEYTTSDIEDYMRAVIVSNFNDILGDMHVTLTDIPGMSLDLANLAKASISDDFSRIGMQLVTFQVEAITPPDEVTKRIDEGTGMAAIGDLAAYTQFQAAQAMRDAAQNPGGGGAAATGVGLGAGMAMGQAMADAINRGSTSSTPAAGGSSVGSGKVNFCSNCGTAVPAGAKFCPNCGQKLTAE